jgi:hypothetical protein
MIESLARCTDLLKYFASSAVTFATADNSIAATGIGTEYPTVGKHITIAGAAESGNVRTFTIASVPTANKIIVTETVTAESAGAAVTINEEYQSDWEQAFPFKDIVGTVNASQNCTLYLDFVHNIANTTPDYTITLSVVGGVAEAIDERVLAHYVRMRVLNGGTDQTAMRAYINGLS